MRRNELPDTCFSVLPSTGQLIIIKKSESGYREKQRQGKENVQQSYKTDDAATVESDLHSPTVHYQVRWCEPVFLLLRKNSGHWNADYRYLKDTTSLDVQPMILHSFSNISLVMFPPF